MLKKAQCIIGGFLFLILSFPVYAEESPPQKLNLTCKESIIHSFSVADYLWEEERKKIFTNITFGAVAKTKEISALNRRYLCYTSTICWGLGKTEKSTDDLPNECNLGVSTSTESLYTNAKGAFTTLDMQYNACNTEILNLTLDQTTIRQQCEEFESRKKKYALTEIGNDFSQNLSLEIQGVFAGKLLELTKRLTTLHEKVGRFVKLLNRIVKEVNCTIPETKKS